MKLDFLPLGKLAVSKANMRYAKKAPDVADILPTVRRRGVIQSLIVRPEGDAGRYEILAGARRFHAARIVAAEADPDAPDAYLLPCAILDPGDDAAAVEASLIENIARLDPDEVTQWVTFTRLVREGRKPEDIATTFGMPGAMLRRILALGNLLPRIRDLYRAERIDAATIRPLTMASKTQQRDWLALFDDPEKRAPTGQQLKAWLFGGQSIKAGHALFDIAESGLASVADLFGADRYFVDPEAFWNAQNAAIEVRRAAYLEAGWREVVLIPPGEQFAQWEYEKTPKRKGGRVLIDVRANGEVVFHEGYLSRKEARRAERDTQPEAAKPARPEVTSALQTYIDLHRHAAARAALIGHGQVALRLLVAHAIIGSHLFRVTPEPQATRNDAVAESVETSWGEAVFDTKRRIVLGLLGFDPEQATVTGGHGDDGALVRVFARLLDLSDEAVLEVVTIVIGEALASGSAAVEAVGAHLHLDMAQWWQADPAFFDLLRDKQVLVAMVGDVAGATIAAANAKEKGATCKRIIADHLEGAGGRTKVEHWVPRWMAFPPAAYTERGGVGSVRAAALVAAAQARVSEPDPDAPVPMVAPQDARLAA